MPSCLNRNKYNFLFTFLSLSFLPQLLQLSYLFLHSLHLLSFLSSTFLFLARLSTFYLYLPFLLYLPIITSISIPFISSLSCKESAVHKPCGIAMLNQWNYQHQNMKGRTEMWKGGVFFCLAIREMR